MYYKKIIELANNAGTIVITIDVDFPRLSQPDHAFLTSLINLIQDYVGEEDRQSQVNVGANVGGES